MEELGETKVRRRRRGWQVKKKASMSSFIHPPSFIESLLSPQTDNN